MDLDPDRGFLCVFGLDTLLTDRSLLKLAIGYIAWLAENPDYELPDTEQIQTDFGVLTLKRHPMIVGKHEHDEFQVVCYQGVEGNRRAQQLIAWYGKEYSPDQFRRSDNPPQLSLDLKGAAGD